MIPRGILATLVTAALVLPVAIVIVLGVGRLLGAMNDAQAALVLDRVALALGILWGVNLVALVIAQGINGMGPPGDPPGARL